MKIKIIKFKQFCISCGKKVGKLKEGHCGECIEYFKREWMVKALQEEDEK